MVDSRRDHVLWEVEGIDSRMIRRVDFRKKKRKAKRAVRTNDIVSSPQTSNRKYGVIYNLFDEDGQRWSVAHNGQEPVSPSAASDIHPSVSRDGAKLTFTSGRSGRGDIYVAATDATNQPPKLVARGQSVELSPQWSPDGKTLAFLRLSERGSALVALSNVRSAPTETILADERMSPVSFSWRPDGQELAFYRRDFTAGTTLNVVSAGGGVIKRRLSNVQVQPRGPAWLKHDGWSLVAIRTNDALVAVTPSGDIWPLPTHSYGHGEVRTGSLFGKRVVVFTALGVGKDANASMVARRVYVWAVPSTLKKPNTAGDLPDFQ